MTLGAADERLVQFLHKTEGDAAVKRFIGFVVVSAVALVVTANALADARITATATANTDRSVSVSWNVPAGSFGGDLITNTTSLTDVTGAFPFNAVGDPTIDFNLLNTGMTSYKTLPLNMTITQPTTVYLQVQLIDPFGDGSCSQGDFYVECDSPVVPLTIQPICTQVLVRAGYYTKKLVKRGHWLRSHGHYVLRHGDRVWIKAKYKKIWHPPVYETQCH